MNRDKSFFKKTVLITGGSRGLGLAIAREFLKEDAVVVLLARRSEELEQASDILRTQFPKSAIYSFECDVTQKLDITETFEMIAQEVGPISVVVNNAGSILVSPYDSLTEDDFRAQMELHLFAIVGMCRLSVDHFRENKIEGRIVNICSLGGKIAVPHMITYDTSKFALAGFSQGLTSELAEEGISVTTVYPTVMRTGSPIQAVFKGDHEKEYAWFASTDSMPMLSLKAESAAKKIVKACRNRRAELIPSFAAKLRLIAGVLFPQTMAWSMNKVAKKLPKTQSLSYKTGAESERVFKQTPIYKKLKTSIESTKFHLNQHPGSDAEFNLGLTTEPDIEETESHSQLRQVSK